MSRKRLNGTEHRRGFANTQTPLPAKEAVSTTHLLTFHHVLLVVTVIVAVCGSVVDVKAVDRGVVVAGWDILHGVENRHVHSVSEKSPQEKEITRLWNLLPSPGFELRGGPSKHSSISPSGSLRKATEIGHDFILLMGLAAFRNKEQIVLLQRLSFLLSLPENMKGRWTSVGIPYGIRWKAGRRVGYGRQRELGYKRQLTAAPATISLLGPSRGPSGV